jgi:hypothetical protein
MIPLMVRSDDGVRLALHHFTPDAVRRHPPLLLVT